MTSATKRQPKRAPILKFAIKNVQNNVLQCISCQAERKLFPGKFFKGKYFFLIKKQSNVYCKTLYFSNNKHSFFLNKDQFQISDSHLSFT